VRTANKETRAGRSIEKETRLCLNEPKGNGLLNERANTK
jgi:hypothetical protein